MRIKSNSSINSVCIEKVNTNKIGLIISLIIS